MAYLPLLARRLPEPVVGVEGSQEVSDRSDGLLDPDYELVHVMTLAPTLQHSTSRGTLVHRRCPAAGDVRLIDPMSYGAGRSPSPRQPKRSLHLREPNPR